LKLGVRLSVLHAGPALLLLLALTALALVARAEFGVRLDLPLQWDELFFLTCTARGEVPGALAAAGCQDNKGPLIYWVYQGLLVAGELYDPVRLKAAAIAVALLNVGLVGVLAYRHGRWTAAAFASSLLLIQLAAAPALLALKTEVVGVFFILLALWLLDASTKGLTALRALAVGALLGLAMLAKQVFVLPLLALLFALLCWPRLADAPALAGPRSAPGADRRVGLSRGSRWTAFGAAVWVGLGACLVVAAYLLLVWRLGRLDDALASLVLNVTLYGSPDTMSALQRWAWRLGGLGQVLLAVLPLAVLSTWQVLAAGLGPSRERDGATLPHGLRAAWVGCILIALLTPLLNTAHLLPLLALAAPLAGLLLARLLKCLPTQSGLPLGAMAGVLLYALCVALAAWFGPNARPDTGRSFYRFEPVNSSGARYGYVVGIWPEFYTFNHLVPATDVMYPTALPGAPASWMYKAPDPSTPKGRWAAAAFERNAQSLLVDFAKTPPRYIHVANAMARSKDTEAATDIPVLATYIAQHCVQLRVLKGAIQHAGTLYECSNGR
jgi:hypothetical protein